jgi:hypothetical protein
MALKNRQELKNYFSTDLRPTENNFADLIDSNLNISNDKADNINALNPAINDKFITPQTASIIVAPILTSLGTKEPAITVSTVDKYWSGTKTFRNLATDVRDVVLTGISTAAASTILATDKIIVAFAKLQSQITLKQDKLKSYTLADTAIANLKTINGNSILYNPSFPLDNNILIAGGNVTKIVLMPLLVTFTTPTSANSALNVLPSISLLANKTYMFKGKILLTMPATTTRTTSFGFTPSAGFTTPVIDYTVRTFSLAPNSITPTISNNQINSTGIKLINITNALNNTIIEFEGVIRTNSLGALTPQVSFNAAFAANLISVRSGSYAEFLEIGPDTFISN